MLDRIVRKAQHLRQSRLLQKLRTENSSTVSSLSTSAYDVEHKVNDFQLSSSFLQNNDAPNESHSNTRISNSSETSDFEVLQTLSLESTENFDAVSANTTKVEISDFSTNSISNDSYSSTNNVRLDKGIPYLFTRGFLKWATSTTTLTDKDINAIVPNSL